MSENSLKPHLWLRHAPEAVTYRVVLIHGIRGCPICWAVGSKIVIFSLSCYPTYTTSFVLLSKIGLLHKVSTTRWVFCVCQTLISPQSGLQHRDPSPDSISSLVFDNFSGSVHVLHPLLSNLASKSSLTTRLPFLLYALPKPNSWPSSGKLLFETFSAFLCKLFHLRLCFTQCWVNGSINSMNLSSCCKPLV